MALLMLPLPCYALSESSLVSRTLSYGCAAAPPSLRLGLCCHAQPPTPGPCDPSGVGHRLPEYLAS